MLYSKIIINKQSSIIVIFRENNNIKKNLIYYREISRLYSIFLLNLSL